MSTDVSYQLPQIPYLHLRFTLIAEQETSLPSFKGSMLRGAFGHALRRTVCVMGPQQPCPACMLRQQCVYPRLFETLIEPDDEAPRFLQGLPTAPRPYIFEPFDEKLLYRAGETLQFDLILLGQAIVLHPFAIFAVSQMAESGLSARRFRFRLQEVRWEAGHKGASGKYASVQVRSEKLQVASEQEVEGEWRLLYDGAAKRLLEKPTPQPANRSTGEPSYRLTVQPSNRLTVNFITPTRLKFNNALTIDFTFRMLVFKMLRRVLELAHFHVSGATIDWEFHPLLIAADAVKIVQRDLRWVDWERRSNRQKTEMKMGGFVGEMILEGELAPFMELLSISEVIHVGKGAVFGNGKIKINSKKQTENSK